MTWRKERRSEIQAAGPPLTDSTEYVTRSDTTRIMPTVTQAASVFEKASRHFGFLSGCSHGGNQCPYSRPKNGLRSLKVHAGEAETVEGTEAIPNVYLRYEKNRSLVLSVSGKPQTGHADTGERLQGDAGDGDAKPGESGSKLVQNDLLQVGDKNGHGNDGDEQDSGDGPVKPPQPASFLLPCPFSRTSFHESDRSAPQICEPCLQHYIEIACEKAIFAPIET